MRQVIGGNGSDTTAATQSYLDSTDQPYMRDLIVIGDPADPHSIWLTDHEAPVLYPPYGMFFAAVVARDPVEAKIGLDAQALKIEWSPGAPAATSGTVNTGTASPYQLAAQQPFIMENSMHLEDGLIKLSPNSNLTINLSAPVQVSGFALFRRKMSN